MKRVLPLLLIVGFSKPVEGQQQLIPFVEKYEKGLIEITYYKKTQNRIEKVKHEEYYSNGQKEGEGTYKNGEKDGKWTSWYESGQKQYEWNFKDGEVDGKWTEWYENGQKMREETYKDGELISSKYWDKDGNLEE